MKEQTRGYVYAALNDHCFGPISSAFASGNKNSCKFGNKLICQLIWSYYFRWILKVENKMNILQTYYLYDCFSAFEVLKLIDKSADCSWKSTIFRAFASEDKNRAAFVTITSAAFDPEKATFSPDNKWWSCRDWRQSVMHGTAFRVLICICVCVFSPTFIGLSYSDIYQSFQKYKYFGTRCT